MSFASDRRLWVCGTGRPQDDRSGELHLHDLNDTGFPKLSAPARWALSGAGCTHLEQLAQVSESDLENLHGMGPTAISALRAALDQRGLSFRA
jgi:hypothetical protein